MERIEGSAARMGQTPSVRSLTHTKEVERTVTAKPEIKPTVLPSENKFRNPSHKSPEPLSSPYSSLRKSEFYSPNPIKTYPTPVKTKFKPKVKKSPVITFGPKPTVIKTPIYTESPPVETPTTMPDPVTSPEIEPDEPAIEEHVEDNETNDSPDNGS